MSTGFDGLTGLVAFGTFFEVLLSRPPILFKTSIEVKILLNQPNKLFFSSQGFIHSGFSVFLRALGDEFLRVLLRLEKVAHTIVQACFCAAA